jgi:hypothetical protein
MNATNNEGIPYCEWPDPDKPGIFRNCCDKDGRVDNNLRKIAAKNRIGEIREQLNAGSGLTTRKWKALYHEADRLERMFGLGRFAPVPVAEMDERKDKATQKKLKWLGKKEDRSDSQKGIKLTYLDWQAYKEK